MNTLLELSRRLTRIAGPGLLALAAAITVLARPAAALDVQEYEVKAAYLYNFARFVEWPALPEGSLQVCIVGRDPFGPALAGLEGRSVQGRTVRVRRDVAVSDLGACQIAFISDSEERRLPMILRTAAGQPVLVVSDIEGFADGGGMIGLALADQKVQFDVNLAPIRQSGLKVPAQVLKLARQVLNPKGRP